MFYPTITTTKNNWREMINQATGLKLTSVCFFPTALSKKKRVIAYKLLKNSTIKKIPLVHLKDDFEIWELKFFLENFDTGVFNIHSQIYSSFKLSLKLIKKYKSILTVENTRYPFDDEPGGYLGICLDVSHLENMRKGGDPIAKNIENALKKFPIKAAHISAFINKEKSAHDSHYYNSLKDFNYLVKYKKYLPNICAMELENTISQQLKAIDYIKNTLLLT